jgi:hypothetical protein
MRAVTVRLPGLSLILATRELLTPINNKVFAERVVKTFFYLEICPRIGDLHKKLAFGTQCAGR